MAKSAKNRHRHRYTPYPISHHFCWNSKEPSNSKRTLITSEQKDYEEATCSVCMEFPHNAVLLLCSSHDNGCRPYMCGTGHRHSNCLQQFKNSRTKFISTESNSSEQTPMRLPLVHNSNLLELSCPLCRGPVKGWTVVDSARRYLNSKKRSCMQDDCSFMGTYKELKKHVKSEHKHAKKLHRVDPEMEEKWRALELEIEQRDVVSTIMSFAPRSVVFGDYVIEMVDDAEGEDETDGGGEDELGLSRNILYVLREGARLMGMRWDDGVARDDGVVSGGRRRRRRRNRGENFRFV